MKKKRYKVKLTVNILESYNGEELYTVEAETQEQAIQKYKIGNKSPYNHKILKIEVLGNG